MPVPKVSRPTALTPESINSPEDIAAYLSSTMPDISLPPQHPARSALPYVLGCLDDFYLYGHSLKDLVLQDIFPIFYDSAHAGFCYALAALSMFTLRDNPTSRIVYVNCQAKGDFHHAWVEFQLNGLQWIFDASCRLLPLRLRNEYYLHLRAQSFYSCSHAEFWRLPISSQFVEKLHSPATSYLLHELVEYYSWYAGSNKPFHRQIADFCLPSDAGRRINKLIALDRPELSFLQPTLDRHLTTDTASLYAARDTIWQNYLIFCQMKHFCP